LYRYCVQGFNQYKKYLLVCSKALLFSIHPIPLRTVEPA